MTTDTHPVAEVLRPRPRTDVTSADAAATATTGHGGVEVPAGARQPLLAPRSHDATSVALDLASAGALSWLVVTPPGPTGTVHPLVHGLLAALWVVLLAGARCYAPGPLPGGSGGLRRVARAATAFVATLAVLPVLLPPDLVPPIGPGHLVALAGLSAVAGVAQRSRPLARRTRRRGRRPAPRVLVVGHGRDVARAVLELGAGYAPGQDGVHVVAVCTPSTSRTRFDVPVVRGFDLLPSALGTHGVEVVVVLPCHHFDPLVLRRLGWQLESAGVHLVVASGLLDVDRSRARTLRAGGLHLVHVRHAELTGARRLLKQLWERAAAVLALIVLGPLLALLAVAIRLDSPGPALFRQVRIGKDGQPFVMLKARTMTADAEGRLAGLVPDAVGPDGGLFKMRSDPRVTRLGRVLRRYSIDELPQLVNVARGEMSLVGPRPALPAEVLRYDGDTLRRLAVRPGMTGLWQVSGRSDLPWDQTVRLDLKYVDNWSLGLDVLIVVRTLRAVLGHRGAY